MITTQNRCAGANISTANLKNGTDFSIAAIMARDELSRESSEYSISKDHFCVFNSFFKNISLCAEIFKSKNLTKFLNIKIVTLYLSN